MNYEIMTIENKKNEPKIKLKIVSEKKIIELLKKKCLRVEKK